MSYNLPSILIVDDSVLNLQVTTEILKEKGYRIGVAQSGKEALKQIQVQIPDLILLDVMMPDMDGFEVCRRIKTQNKWSDIPIIFLTAKSQTEDIVEAFKIGGADYLTKPFQPEELTVRVKNHVDLYHSKLKIKELNAERDKLYSIIAHDIKTPFTNIIFIVRAIKDKHVEAGTPEFDEIIVELEKSTVATNELLVNLLEWARYQSGIVNPKFQMCDLNTLVLETGELLKPTAQKKNINTEFILSHDCQIYADAVTVKTAIRNLYTNAIKFSDVGKTIKIGTIANGDFNDFYIEDNGVGMEKDVIDKIFVHRETYTTIGSQEESGTGLGLRVVQDFVKLNKGTLDVVSKLNEGTKFTLKLHAKPFKTLSYVDKLKVNESINY